MKRFSLAIILALAAAATAHAKKIDLDKRAGELVSERFRPTLMRAVVYDHAGVRIGRHCALPVSSKVFVMLRHALMGAHDVKITAPDGLLYKIGGVVGEDYFAGLVYLRIDAPRLKFRPPALGGPPVCMGTRVFVISPPGDRIETFEALVKTPHPVPLGGEVYVLEGAVPPSASGFPAVTAEGAFIGIASVVEGPRGPVVAALPVRLDGALDSRRPMPFEQWRKEAAGDTATVPLQRATLHVWAADYTAAAADFHEAAVAAANNADYWYFEAWSRYMAGDYEGSLAPLKEALDINPLRDAAHTLIACSYAALDRFDEARGHFTESLLSAPGDTLIHIELGQRFEEAGFYDVAVSCYKKAVKADGADPVAWYRLGAGLRRLGREEEALTALETACGLDGDFCAMQLELARCLLATARSRRALEVLHELVRRTPNDIRALEALGDAYAALSRHGMAIIAYTRALRLEHINPDVWRKVGHAHRSMGRRADAAISYRSAALQDPGNAYHHYLHGTAAHEAGNFDEALEAHGEAVALEPGSGRYAAAMADTLLALAKYDEAEKYYRAALTRNPGLVEAEVGLGRLMRVTGRYDESLEALDTAAVIDPLYAPLYFERGLTYGDSGHDSEAAADFARVVELDPDHFQSWCEMGLALARLGMDERAVAAFEEAGHLRDDYAATFRHLAAALLRLERYVEVIYAANHAIHLDEDNGELYFLRGKAWYHLDQSREALKSMQHAIKLDGDLDEARYVAARIYLRSGNRAGARVEYEELKKLRSPWVAELSFAFSEKRTD